MTLREVKLDDKYAQEIDAPLYINGTQALLRLSLNQIWRDQQSGLHTAAYITGYRGSPMHNVDKEVWRATQLLEDNNVYFHPAVNEDLAATACWGTQQSPSFEGAKFDGVASLWFGKGPGLDRSADAIRHANLSGTSQYGGVLAAVGDDAGMKSSDVPAASETMFTDLFMPVLYPSTVQEVLDYGILGWAMSRFSGLWTGFKLTADTVDTVACVDGNPNRIQVVIPEFEFPADGVHHRINDPWVTQEPRLQHYKIKAALAFARANNINARIIDSPNRRYGIISAGKAAINVQQAMVEMGLSPEYAAEIGISVLKIGMPYPLCRDTLRDFSAGLEEVFVIEEKRRTIEVGLKDALFDIPSDQRPNVIGRHNEEGQQLIPDVGDFGPEDVVRALAPRIAYFHSTQKIRDRIDFLNQKAELATTRKELSIKRIPYFCSGCPHNTSTKVPEGSQALGGVGCHFMSTYMERGVVEHTHMGAEGANWIGIAPFSKTQHIFQNMGDGTYYHSGIMAIRAAISAKVNITYKILFNDAVAMTGGQPHDGVMTPISIAQQCHAEGVTRIVVVTDEPDKYPANAGFPAGTEIEHRRKLEYIQTQLREESGVTILIYDQTCAAEKRRRRKKKIIPDPARRLFINHRICEGCGDCSKASNCLSVTPMETDFGRKRKIDQSSCNKDYSCAEGFCPSFVQVVGATPKKLAKASGVPPELINIPHPVCAQLPDGDSYNILITGIGGTGVVTIAAVITMAAHLEGKAFSTIDEFGMAQKGGAVKSHVRVAGRPEDLGPSELSTGTADLILGCDSLVTCSDDVLKTIAKQRTYIVVNTNQAITGHSVLNPDLVFPTEAIDYRIRHEGDDQKMAAIDASQLATNLMGDSIMSNMFTLGFAYQQGQVPLSFEAIMKAIEINGIAIEANKTAFEWGRRYAYKPEAITAMFNQTGSALPDTLDAIVKHYSAELSDYQNSAYAERYKEIINKVQKAEKLIYKNSTDLSTTVARNLYKLMAYKDEYEVARLYSSKAFREGLEEQFDNIGRIELLLAPPLLTRKDKKTGKINKKTFGPWVFPAMKQLAKLKGLRGTRFDIFGYTVERREERRLIAEYEEVIDELIKNLTKEKYELAISIASIPHQIRGYGHVKELSIKTARSEWEKLFREFRNEAQVVQVMETFTS